METFLISSPRHDECFIETRTRCKKTNRDLSSGTEILFNVFQKTLLKYRGNECFKLLESFKKEELKLLGPHQYLNFKKR